MTPASMRALPVSYIPETAPWLHWVQDTMMAPLLVASRSAVTMSSLQIL